MISTVLVTAALVGLLPALNPSRIDELAQTISAVAETQDDVARLAVTVARESSGLRSYETCDLRGAAGELTGFQLMRSQWAGYSRAELCEDPVVAASVALKLLRRFKSFRVSAARYLGRDRFDVEVTTRVRLYMKALAAMGGSA